MMEKSMSLVDGVDAADMLPAKCSIQSLGTGRVSLPLI